MRPFTSAFRRAGTGLYPGLDGLRAISVLMVILGHLYWAPSFPGRALAGIVNPANLGVRMFFVISGFLITSLLLDERDRHGAVDLVRFYYRRTLRIFPAYYVFLLVVAALAAFGVFTLERGDLIWALTYTFNMKGEQPTWWLGHTWSLAVEEQFYLLWPAVVSLASRRTLGRVVITGLLIPPALRWFTIAIVPSIHARIVYALPVVADPLALGAGLALLFTSTAWQDRLRMLVAGAWWWFVPPAVLLIEALNNRPHLFPHPVVLASLLQPVANLGLGAILMRAVLMPRATVTRVLEWPALASIGVMSYSLYLWQMLFISMSTHPAVTFPLSLVWTALTATLSFLLVERPVNELRHREPSWLPTRRRVVSAGR